MRKQKTDHRFIVVILACISAACACHPQNQPSSPATSSTSSNPAGNHSAVQITRDNQRVHHSKGPTDSSNEGSLKASVKNGVLNLVAVIRTADPNPPCTVTITLASGPSYPPVTCSVTTGALRASIPVSELNGVTSGKIEIDMDVEPNTSFSQHLSATAELKPSDIPSPFTGNSSPSPLKVSTPRTLTVVVRDHIL
jgi:hypothetical protein